MKSKRPNKRIYSFAQLQQKFFRRKRYIALKTADSESLTYRKAFYSKFHQIYVSPQDQRDIDVGRAIMNRATQIKLMAKV